MADAPAGPEAPPAPEAAAPALPDVLPVLPLRGTVVFPEATAPLAIGEARSVRLIDDVLDRPERLLVLVASRDPEQEEPAPEVLYEVGTAALVQRMVRVPDGSVRILAQGLQRVRIRRYVEIEPYLAAEIEPVPDRVEHRDRVEA